MSEWRRFERSGAGATEYREIRQEGIRCFLTWGTEGGAGKGSTSVLNDEAAAVRHAGRKVAEWQRKGFAEAVRLADPVAARPEPVLDVLARPTGPHAARLDFLPVDGVDEVYTRVVSPGHPRSWHEYLVLSDAGMRAVRFAVQAGAHASAAVSVFLRFLGANRGLAFDGRSHHKVLLPEPVAGFGHALLCAPPLGPYGNHPVLRGRVATAFPIHDCEIGDADTEVLVDARIHGHGSLPSTDWAREPRAVVDLRFDVRPSWYRPSRSFKVFGRSDLDRLLGQLADAEPDSRLEVRSFRGEVLLLTPGQAVDPAVVARHLTG
ncbi:hypothetical protein [Kitasatospora sp. NPDC059571]|uniref:hypothetical protein n=1 Tax=Kitasatospora sp. NPDC059571 TaxID=3346871 RepID=UPI003699F85D